MSEDPAGCWLSLREAWHRALYGEFGFYRHALPRQHFRTAAHSAAVFAAAMARLADRCQVSTVTDLGSGGGELLAELHRIRPDLRLAGVDVHDRPPGLPAAVRWRDRLPERLDGLVVANELLDNIPCDVVELDDSGVVRTVQVDLGTGAQRLGAPADTAACAWVDTWWPLTVPGQRAEVGTAREQLWADVAARIRDGCSVFIDYGHVRGRRPNEGTLSSYRSGTVTPPVLDGRHDVTAAVAVDALAAHSGGRCLSQREAMHDLGVSGERPALPEADTDPAGYLRALARASHATALTAPSGFGGFWWLLTAHGRVQR